MNNYVISLKSAEARRIHIVSEFTAQNISFKFFDAVTPNNNIEVAHELGLNISNTELTHGEIACLLSHISLWKKAIDENLDYITIFEDDIYLGKNAHVILNNFTWIHPDIHIIKLEAFSKKVKISYQSFLKLPNQRKLYTLNGIHLGCAGYILSYQACQKLLEYARNLNVMIAVDHIVFEEYITKKAIPIYQLNPALCIQSDILNQNKKTVFISSLEQERRKRFDIKVAYQKKKLTLKQKIIREWFRLLRQIVNYYEHRLIKFR